MKMREREREEPTHFAASVLMVPVPTMRAAMAMWKAAIPGLLILNRGIFLGVSQINQS